MKNKIYLIIFAILSLLFLFTTYHGDNIEKYILLGFVLLFGLSFLVGLIIAYANKYNLKRQIIEKWISETDFYSINKKSEITSKTFELIIQKGDKINKNLKFTVNVDEKK